MVACPWEHLRKRPELCLPLTTLKGVGPRRAELLAQKGLLTPLDLLYFVPIRYEDRTCVLPVSDARHGDRVWVKGKPLVAREAFFPKSRKRLFKAVIEDGSGQVNLFWFHYKKAYLLNLIKKGREVMVFGEIQEKGSEKQIIHPEIKPATVGDQGDDLCIYPIYTVVDGIPPRTLKSLISKALEQYGGYVEDPVPRDIRERRGLPDLREALEGLHRPPPEADMELLERKKSPYHQRLAFDFHLKTLLNLELRKRVRRHQKVPPLTVSEDLMERLNRDLPFSLTKDQVGAVEAITADLKQGRPMSRMVHGDVGCGKTVVAAVAAYLVVKNGKQVAFMAPTQVLAAQHHHFFLSLSKKMGFRSALLTGAMKAENRRKVYEQIEKGLVNVVIGTQALIQEPLNFADLGLAIVDEQHRFGVRQRSILDGKGRHPHLLVMSATPIPRTLAMTLYGDMDISSIREYPAGHLPVVTRLVPKKHKRQVYEVLKKRMADGQQAMVICPVIDASEDEDMKSALDMAKKLEALFTPPFRVEVIHGRMTAERKNEIMEDFRKGNTQLLVGTTVMEVGIHAPGATVMVIEQPELFGLAQLHQLRGRVGRGKIQGLCLLMLSENTGDLAGERLDLLIRTSDGFLIAQKDLEMRGQGRLMGVNQAGTGEWSQWAALSNPDLLTVAREEAIRIIDEDPGLTRAPYRPLRGLIEPEWGKPLEL
ncbi:MAG: ATP-dependent DNA helicase RecG [Desulfatiglandaceae bacterium]